MKTQALTSVNNVSAHAALLGAWLASYTATATQAAYRADARHYLAYLDHIGLDLLNVSRKHIDLYARTRQPFDAPATLARRLACISALYRYAQAEELIPTNPATLVRRPVVEKDHSTTENLTHTEAIRFLDAAHDHSPRAYALALLLLSTGVRISEALGATEADLGADRLKIRRKGGKQAVVPLPESLRIVLRELTSTTGTEITRGEEAEAPIFRTATGRPWARTDAARTLRKISRSAGIGKTVSPHVLRHTHATLALDAGVALHHLQDSLGHADPRTTRRYDHSRGRLRDHSTHTVARMLI